MLVKHLIRELQKCDPEVEVITEDCDCVGDTFSLAIGVKQVEICRADRFIKDTDTYENTSDTPHPL